MPLSPAKKSFTASQKISHILLALTLLYAGLSLCGFIFRSTPRPPLRTVTVVETFPLPFETDYIDVPTEYKGYREVVSPGAQGERRIQAQVIYQGSRPIRVAAINVQDIGIPIRQVIRRGVRELRTETLHGAWEKNFISPLDTGWLSADFYDYPGHNGIDLAAPFGTPVYASAGGEVLLAGWYGEYGYCVILGHPDGVRTLYAHNSWLNVRPGQTVRQGQQIARVGSTGNSTGNHLHFEIRANGQFLDPLLYLEQ